MLGESFSFFFDEMDIVTDHHDTVSCGNSAQGNKRNHGRYGKFSLRKVNGNDTSYEGQGDIKHNLKGKGDWFKMNIENEEHAQKG